MKHLIWIAVFLIAGCTRDRVYISVDSKKMKVGEDYSNTFYLTENLHGKVIIRHFLPNGNLNVYFVFSSSDSFYLKNMELQCHFASDTVLDAYTIWMGDWDFKGNEFSLWRSWSEDSCIGSNWDKGVKQYVLAVDKEYRDVKRQAKLGVAYSFVVQAKDTLLSINGINVFYPKTNIRMLRFPDDFRGH